MSAKSKTTGAFGADDALVDYILGITFEIWEQRGIELIHQYYSEQTIVYALDGITRGAGMMVDGTKAMLEAFPDRLLLADDVIWSGNREQGYYSSHRILSPMTNLGPSRYGPATEKSLRILTIADCVVEEGVITREWLIRDNRALCLQLGFDPIEAAGKLALSRGDDCLAWIASETERVSAGGTTAVGASFEERTLTALWGSGDQAILIDSYAPYAVAHRSPIELYSGKSAVLDHYESLRNAIDVQGVSVDHVATQPYGSDGQSVALRWAVTGTHVGELFGVPASGKPVYILGSTHWRIVANRIAVEWTVFDGMGVLAQIV
jgi:hypothetical protein